ncbi:MAG: dihydrofolate reductase [Beijerinckiaceae bacterium]|nr:dihydrofolate reductase [Beijerinckiaceae bacterium]
MNGGVKTHQPPLVLVVAVGRNQVIGGDGRLPWRLPSDLNRFKAVTMGKPMLMGRKTFEAIGRPLPGREIIVLTRDPVFTSPGIHVAHTLDDGLKCATDCARTMGASEVIIAGGGDLYRQTLAMASRLDVTQVDLSPVGDATFPHIDDTVWRETSRTKFTKGEKDDAPFTVVIFERR